MKKSRQIGRARGGRSAGTSSQSGRSSSLSYSRFRIPLVGLNSFSLTVHVHALSRRVHTRDEISHVARYAAEANGERGIPPRAIGVDRALCNALVPLLLGTISNWPRATIARGSASERYAYARTYAYTRVQKRARPGILVAASPRAEL